MADSTRSTTHERGSRRLPSVFGIAALLLLLTACGASPPLVPPTELSPVDTQVTLTTRWKSKRGAAGQTVFVPHVTADSVFVADRAGKVARLDLDSGKALWATDLAAESAKLYESLEADKAESGNGLTGTAAGPLPGLGGVPLPASGGAQRPALGRIAALGGGVSGGNDLIFVSSDNGVVQALSSASGEPLWSAAASSEVLVPASIGFGAVLVRSNDGRILALEPGTGTERWSTSFTPPSLTLHGYSRPLALDGGALVGLDDGRLVALDLGNGREIWETVLSVPSGRSEVERLVDIDADIQVDQSAIYVVNYQGRLARVEPGRGQIDWSVPLSSTAGFTLFDGKIVVVDEEDVLRAFDASDGTELWSTRTLRGRRLSPPASTAQGDIVVGDFEGYLHVLSADDGRLTGRTRIDKSAVRARSAIVNDAVVVQSVAGTVTAIDLSR